MAWWRLVPVFVFVAALAASPARGAEPLKIRASWIVSPSDWAPLLPEKPDLMRHHGKSYVYEPVRYAGTPAVITAMANSEVELGNLAFSSLGIAIQNAGLDDLRIVADQFRDGAGDGYSNQFFVLKDSPIQKVDRPQGQDRRHQRRRQRGRHRHAGDAAQARPGGQARLHGGRGAVPHHEGDADAEEGRSRHVGRAVRIRSRAQADRAAAVHPEGGDRHHADDRVGRAQGDSWRRTAPP